MKTIQGFPDYVVETGGHVYSIKRKRYLKPFLVNNRFMTVNLRTGNKTKARKVHELVLEAFVGPCPAGCKPIHIDGDRANNKLENLEYMLDKPK